MVQQGRVAVSDEFELAAMWRAIRRRKIIVVGLTLAAALIAVAYLNFTAYYYTAQLQVVPATKEGETGPTRRLGGLAAIAGLDGGHAGELSFTLYKQGLLSRDVAEILSRDQQLMRRIFANEWDEQTGQWAQPRNPRTTAGNFLKQLLGLPVYAWTRPDAARLQQFLQDRIVIEEVPDSPIVTVRFNDTDPVFATQFLTRLSRTVDQLVRQRTLRKTGDYIQYLSGKLQTVTLAEHRASLATALAEQERQRMLASSSAPFAAEPVDRVVASILPTTPRPERILGAATLAGLLLGASVAFMLGRREEDGSVI